MSSPSKKTKSDDNTSCVTNEAESIPVNTVSRMLAFKVTGEKDAVQAEKVLKNIHEIFKQVEGFQGGYRFVCKEHWDMKYFVRFANVPALEGYMGSSVKNDKIEPLVKELEKIAVDGNVHRQNFVVDNWN